MPSGLGGERLRGQRATREEIELRRRAMELDRTLGLFQGDAIFGSPLAPWYAYHF
jgi:hypothetical protein